MPKNDNAHSLRLTESIRQYAGEEKAAAFEQQHPLSKAATPEKKWIWAGEACRFLEERFDDDTILSIRKACRCNDGKTIAQKLLGYLRQAGSLEQLVQAFNANESFAALEYISEKKLRFCYPQCYCACVKRVPGLLPKAWCYCTLGNAEGIFKEVFRREDLKLTLTESIKTGGKRCVIEIELP
jgi:hypothetical protein